MTLYAAMSVEIEFQQGKQGILGYLSALVSYLFFVLMLIVNVTLLLNNRYKSRQEADKDLCGQCYQKSGGTLDDFFEVENILSEMAFHQYFACKYLCSYCFCKCMLTFGL